MLWGGVSIMLYGVLALCCMGCWHYAVWGVGIMLCGMLTLCCVGCWHYAVWGVDIMLCRMLALCCRGCCHYAVGGVGVMLYGVLALCCVRCWHYAVRCWHYAVWGVGIMMCRLLTLCCGGVSIMLYGGIGIMLWGRGVLALCWVFFYHICIFHHIWSATPSPHIDCAVMHQPTIFPTRKKTDTLTCRYFNIAIILYSYDFSLILFLSSNMIVFSIFTDV